MSFDPADGPHRRPRHSTVRERHPTLVLFALKVIAAAGLIYLVAHRFLH
jgi:hypothetical protein